MRSPAARSGPGWPAIDGPVNAVAIGRAGDRDIIVSGSDDGTVRVWDAVTGGPVGGPLADVDSVNAVAIGRAGDRDIIVSDPGDGTVRVWDAVTGNPVGGPLAGHGDPVNAVAIGRAGDRDSSSPAPTMARCGSGTRPPATRLAPAGRPRRPVKRWPSGGPGTGTHRLRLRRWHGAESGTRSPAPRQAPRWPATTAG